ncbi:MAG: hypothetical protein EP329_18880 [Deltaproteobacteria bacterium]|nr:MAG: hypothetical protein EP329_18880 [Deltaproteobacteria bacterium]
MSRMNLLRTAACALLFLPMTAACSGGTTTEGDTDTATNPTDTSGGTDTGYTDNSGPPEVTLQGPKEGQIFQFGDPIPVVAKVSDDRDNPTLLALTLVSDVAGQINTLQANDSGFVTYEIPTLVPGNHTLTLTAKDQGGHVGDASVNIVVNGAPTVGEIEITPEIPVTSDELVAQLTSPFQDPNRAPEELDITWQWFRDGEDQSISQPRVPSARTSKGEQWRVLATATDPWGKRAQVEKIVTIANSPPTCELATLLPSSGRTDTDFTCRCTERTDPDPGDAIADKCEFYNGDSKLTAEGCTLSHEETTRGQNITCRLIPSDGETDGPQVTTTIVPILNTPPTKPEVEISPTAGDVHTTFTCNVTNTPTDADGDAIDMEYTWVVNGYENPGTTSTSVIPIEQLVSNVAGKPARGGDRISCRVRAYDGFERSQSTDTIVITLTNTAPTGGVVTLGPIGAAENDTLLCAANGGTDIDGDTIIWFYTWEINGEALEGVQGAELDPENFTVGDVVNCIATPSDGFEEGVPQLSKNAITIVNAPPTTPVVEVLAPLGADGPVTCHVSEPSFDKEPLTQTIYWRLNNGDEFVGEATLPDGMVDNCNIVECRLEVDDQTTVVTSAVSEKVMPVGSCDSGGDCTEAVCLPNGACSVQNVVGGCSDQNPCTTGDTCVSGVCVGEVKNCDDNQFCTDDSCNPATGQCIHLATTIACDDGNGCTVDTCDQSANGGAGGCTFQPLDNIPCNKDDNGCTVGDRCVAGQCTSGTAFDCEEGQDPNPCLTRSCRSTGANSFVCDNNFFDASVACEDGFWCTIADHCNGQGLCVSGIQRNCALGLSTCQIGSCDEAANACRTEELPDNSSCNFDSNGCTVNDYCFAGLCRQGAAPDCSSVQDDCNAPSCVSTGDSSYSCVAVPEAAGKDCQGDDFCVVHETCDGQGSCVGGEPRDCDAEVGDECLTTYCDSIFAACIPEPITTGTPCDDGDTCSSGDRCVFGVCEATGSICLEEQLNVGSNTAERTPAMAHIGNGRYVTQWHKGGIAATQAFFRVANDQGSREVEETFVGSGLIPTNLVGVGQRILGAAVRANGRFALVTGAGEAYCGASRWCGNAGDRTIDHQVRLVVYDRNVKPVATGSAVTIIGTKPTYDTEISLGFVGLPLAFADGSWGVVVSPQLGGSAGGVSSLARGVWLVPVGADLTGGSPAKLVDLGAVNITKFDVAQFPESDDFVVTWVATDDRTIKALRFDRFGSPSPGGARDIAVVAAGHVVDAVRIAAFRDGGYAVMYTDNPGAAPVGSVVRVFPAILNLPDIAFALDDDAGHTLGKIAAFADKVMVATWTSATADGNGTAVVARVWDANGQPMTDAFVVNATTAGDQSMASLAVVGPESFVVGFVGAAGNVYTRLYSRDGSNLPGRPEIEVTQTPQFDQIAPAAAGDGQGRALVAFESTSTGVTISDIYARQYDLDGLPMGEQYRVNTTTAGAQRNPSVAGASGKFIATWTSEGQDGDRRGIYARRLDGTGAAHGPELRVNASGTGDQWASSVAMNANGDWLAAWVDGTSVRTRGFSGDNPLAGETIVDAGTTGAATEPAVTALPGTTDYFVTWTQAQATGSAPMLARVSKDGALLTTPVLFGGAEGATAIRTAPTVAAGPDGTGLLCWRLASPEQVSCQRFATTDGASVDAVVAMTSGRAVAAPAVGWLPSGSAVVAWAAESVDGLGLAVQYVRVDASGVQTTPRVQASRFRANDQTAPALAVGTGTASPFVAVWQSLGQDIDGWGVYLRALDMLSYP